MKPSRRGMRRNIAGKDELQRPIGSLERCYPVHSAKGSPAGPRARQSRARAALETPPWTPTPCRLHLHQVIQTEVHPCPHRPARGVNRAFQDTVDAIQPGIALILCLKEGRE